MFTVYYKSFYLSQVNKKIFFFFAVLILISVKNLYAQSFPSGFSAPLFKGGWNEVEGFRFDSTGQMYVWEKGGRVWVIDTNGVKLSTPLLDIHEEVGSWRDHGLNGFVLDPNFRTNGYYYLYYTVDRNYLMYYGKPQYVAAADSFFKATIARVTRYTANPATNFTTTIAGSRFILVGEDKKTGMAVLHETHSGGQLVFGRDGSLLVSTGDGGTAQIADSGGTAITITYWQQALADTIIRAKENIGAFRSQMLDCLNGKILRINPANGDGIPSNPYYDAANPRSAKSRVWSLGLRNPFRMFLRSGTGSTDITAGDPGVLYFGDVGWDTWEELNVVTGPRLNFGWPLYEGLTPAVEYQNVVNQFNTDAPNPLYGTGGCTKQFFKFKELLIHATLAPSFPNPCNSGQQIPSSIQQYVHTRPVIDWNHTQQITRTGIYNGNNAAEINLNNASSPVPGPMFFGQASVAGIFYSGTKYPLEYQNTYFQTDYVQGFLRTMKFNSNDVPLSMSNFGVSYGPLVFMEYNPKDQFIYYVQYPNSIFKLSYNQSVNNPPVAVAAQNKIYGPSPLTVNFTGGNSTDPENHPLNYSWNFGDGNTSNIANPSHTFTAPPSTPTTYTVTLTVTDDIAQTSTATLKVYVNNTPPLVTITGFNDGDLYSMAHNTTLPLEATVTDAEHSSAQLTYAWQTILHHNNHDHEESIDNSPVTSTIITPVGCDTPNVFFFRILLTVTDAGGLSTTVEKRIYPACNAPVANFISLTSTGCPGLSINFKDQSGNLPESWSWLFPGGSPSSSTLQNPVVSYPTAGIYDVTLTASNIRGSGNITKSEYVTINSNPNATITPSGTDSVCALTSVLLTANSGSNLSYQWLKKGVNIAGATGNTYNVTTGGTYKVRVTRTTTGCTSTSAPKIIGIYSINAAISANGPVTFCAGDSVILSALNVAGNSYQWLKKGNPVNGAVSPGLTVKNTGNYKVRITDVHGCTKTTQPGTQVTVNCKLSELFNENVFNVKIFPNPLTDGATLQLVMSQQDAVSVKIFDAIGKLVETIADNTIVKVGESELELNTSMLSSGIYFMRVSTGQEAQTLKLVINKK